MAGISPLIGTGDVTNGSDVVSNWSGDPLTPLNAVSPAGVQITDTSGATPLSIGYSIKAPYIDTTSFHLSRAYEGPDSTGVTIEIQPWTQDMVSRVALAASLQDYSVRLAFLAADSNGLVFTLLSATGNNDPGPGNMAFDSDTPASVTAVYLDVLDSRGRNRAAGIDLWSAGDSLILMSIATGSFIQVKLTEAPVNEGPDEWRSVSALTFVGNSGVLSPGEDLAVIWLGRGEIGPAGDFIYLAYASDASGTGFTTTFDAGLDYVAIRRSATVIASPAVGDFTGLWKKYTGADGADGVDGVMASIVAGAGITVDSTDPANPIVSASSTGASTSPRNVGLAFSVASGALTVALKQADGSTDPTSDAPAVVPMTAGSGAVTEIAATGALSLVVPDGATLAHTSGLNGHLYWYALDDDGDLVLAVSQTYFGKSGTVTTTGIDAGATVGTVMYSAAALGDVPFRLLARSVDTQTTAGTWAAVPSTVEIDPAGPYSVRFKAYLNTDQTAAIGTNTKVQCDTEMFDVGGFYDSVSNFRFRPPAGSYMMGGSVYFAGFSSGASAELNLNANGSVISILSVSQNSSSSSPFAIGSTLVVANGTDYFEIVSYQNSSADRNMHNAAAPTVTNFWAERFDAP